MFLSRIVPSLFITLLLSGSLSAAAPSTGDLRLHADALSDLYDLGLNADQLKELDAIASDTAAKAPEAAKLPDDLKAALQEWCDAMIKGDDDRAGVLADKAIELEDKSDLDDPGVNITNAAKKKAADVVKLITAGELANFITARSDEIVSPGEALIDAFDEIRAGTDEDFNDVRDSVADEVVVFVHGNGPDNAGTRGKVGDFLAKVRKMSEGNFKSKRKELEAEATKMFDDVGPFKVMHNWANHVFAEMLSNPELRSAIAEMREHAEPRK